MGGRYKRNKRFFFSEGYIYKTATPIQNLHKALVGIRIQEGGSVIQPFYLLLNILIEK